MALYLLPPMNQVLLLLLLPSKSVQSLTLFKLFLCSSLVAATDNDYDNDYADEYELSIAASVLLHSKINY